MTLALALRLFLAILFARAAWHKLAHRQSFHGELTAYRLLPEPFTRPAVFGLAAAEIFCALCLLFSDAAIMLSILLLLLYAVAMAINLWRGNHRIDCGCGGWLTPRKTLSWILVGRNTCLALLGMSALFLPLPADLSSSEFCFVLFMTATLWLLYEGSEQAISNFQHYRHWKKQSLAGSAH